MPAPRPRRRFGLAPFAALDRLRELFRDDPAGGRRPPVRPELTLLELRMMPDGRPLPLPVIFVGAGAGRAPVVRAYDALDGSLAFERAVYAAPFAGGVRVAAADFTRDGLPDVLAGPGPGGGPNVRVLDGATGDPVAGPLGSFWAFEPDFAGGVNVAAADVDGDTVPDAVVAAGVGGGPRVRVFSGADGRVLADWFAFDPDFRGGISVAAADLTGDGRAEVAVGAGEGGGPRVRVYDPLTGAQAATPLGSFFAFDPAARGGVWVGADALAGDVDGDGTLDLAVGAGDGGGVRVYSGATGAVLLDLAPFGAGFAGGVRVALAYVDDDPYADLVAGTGPGVTATVRVISGATGAQLPGPVGEYQPFGPGYAGGVWVAASNDPPAVTVRTFYDADADGVWDGGEGAAAGVVVGLGDGESAWGGTTGADGGFTFANLATGTKYTATANAPAGYLAPAPASVTTPTSPPFAPQVVDLPLVATAPPPPPPAPAITALADDTGDSATDWLTKDATPTVSGTAPANAVVTVAGYWVSGAADPEPVVLGTATASGAGLWTFAYGTALADGTHVLTAAAGGQTSVPVALTIDTTPPEAALDWPDGTTSVAPPVWVTASDRYGLSAGPATLHVDLNNDGDFLDAGEAGYATATLATNPANPEQGAGAFGGYDSLPVGVTIGLSVSVNDFAGNSFFTLVRLLATINLSTPDWPISTFSPVSRPYTGGPGPGGLGPGGPWPGGDRGPVSAAAFTQPALLHSGTVVAAHPLDLDLSPAPVRGADPALTYASSEVGLAPVVEAVVLSYTSSPTVPPTQVVATLTWDGAFAKTTTYPGTGLVRGAYWGFDLQPTTASLATGRHTYTVDLFVDYPGTTDDISRSVDGYTFVVNRSASPFGVGWGFSDTDQLFDIPAGGTGYPAGKLRRYGRGGWGFYEQVGGGYQSPPGDAGLLAAVAGGYRYTDPEGRQATFDSSGRMTRWASADGYELVTYAYDVNGRLSTVTSPDGGVSTVAYDTSGRATTITAPGNRVTTLAYTGPDANGRYDLTGVTDPAGGLHTFAYDKSHRPLGETWGAAMTSYAYGAGLVTVSAGTETRAVAPAVGRALAAGVNDPGWAKVTNGVGGVTWTRLGGFGLPVEVRAADGGRWVIDRDAAGFVTGETDPLKRQTTYVRDAAGYPTEVTYPDGALRTYAYRTNDQALVVAQDELGRRTTYTYGAPGQLLTVTDPTDGVPNPTDGVVSFAYATGGTAAGLLSTIWDPLGRRSTPVYDAARRPVGLLVGGLPTGTLLYDVYGYVAGWDDPYGARTTVTNDRVGRPVAVTTPDGATTTVSYDAAGRVIGTVSPAGVVTTAAYNLAGRPTGVTEGAGLGSTLERRTTTRYDAAGRSEAVTDPLGNTTTYLYDAVGRPARVLDRAGAAVGIAAGTRYNLAGEVRESRGRYDQWTTYGYDLRGRPTRVTEPLGNAAAAAYDKAGNVEATVDPRGNRTTYSYDGLNRLVGSLDPTPAQGRATAVYDAAGRLVATVDPRVNTTTYDYDDRDRLRAVIDPYNKRTTYGYDLADRLTTVTAPLTNPATLEYDTAKARLRAAVDPAGRRVTYAYNAAGDLRTVTAPGPLAPATTTYEYDALGRVYKVQDAKEQWTTLAYDALDRVVGVQNPRGHSVTAVYDRVGRLAAVDDQRNKRTTVAYDSMNPTVTVTDRRGHATAYRHDAAGRLVTVDPPGPGRVTYGYDAAGNVTRVWDETGRRTSYAYDKMNRLVAADDALDNRSTVAYDAAGNVEATADQRGNWTTFAYDKLNRLVEVRNARNEVSEVVYDDAGRVSATVDARTWRTTYGYDAAGRPETVIDPYLNRTTYAYDPAGNLRTVTAPGPLPLVPVTTTFGYDPLNRLVTVSDPTPATTTYAYDRAGNLESVSDPRDPTYRTTFVYDEANRRTAVLDAKEKVWQTVYDDAGNPVATVDPLDRRTTVTFDARNRPTEVRTPPVGAPTPQSEVSTVVYDAAGRVLATVDPRSKRTTYGYDAVGRLESVLDPYLKRTTVAYDAAGNVRATADQYDQRTTYGYDKLNRVESVTDPTLVTVTYDYDPAGNLRAVGAPGPAGGRVTTTYGYDKLNRVETVTDPTPATTTYAYDPAGNLRAVGVPGPTGLGTSTTTYDYDNANRLRAVADPLGNRTTFAYDPAGNLRSVSDPRDPLLLTTFTYDKRNQRTEVITPAVAPLPAAVTTTVYDDAGRVWATVDPLGHRTTLTYDDLDRVTTVTRPLTASPFTSAVVTFAYDRQANTVARTDANGTDTVVYDDLGRAVVSVDARSKRTTVGYDHAGRVVSVADPNNNLTTYGYDLAGRVTGETDPLGKAATYAYDAAGRPAGATDRLGRRKDWGYDLAGRVTTEKWYTSGALVQTQTFAYDPAGRLTRAADPDGTYTLEYDAAGRVSRADEPFGLWMTFGYDAAGNRTRVDDSKGGVTTTGYDALGRLQSRRAGGAGVTPLRYDYAYTARGEVRSVARYSDLAGATKVGEATYTYDAGGRLTNLQHRTGSGGVLANYTYAYDAADRLTARTENGVGTSYAYDAADQIIQAGAATYGYDPAGNRTNAGYATGAGNRTSTDGVWTYTYDHAGAVEKRSKGANAETWRYTYDHNGQLATAVRSATDAGPSTARATYAYDAFGSRISRAAWDGTTTTTERYGLDGWDTAQPAAAGTENFRAWADLDGGNNLTNRRYFGGSFDDPVARQAGGAVSWYAADALGSVRLTLDAAGAATNTVAYDAFGRSSAGVPADRYGWAGAQRDGLTGLVGGGNGRREYDPAVGRWYSTDPLGFAAGDPNLYRYAGNSPTNLTDPSGLWTGGVGGGTLPTPEPPGRAVAGDRGDPAYLRDGLPDPGDSTTGGWGGGAAGLEPGRYGGRYGDLTPYAPGADDAGFRTADYRPGRDAHLGVPQLAGGPPAGGGEAPPTPQPLSPTLLDRIRQAERTAAAVRRMEERRREVEDQLRQAEKNLKGATNPNSIDTGIGIVNRLRQQLAEINKGLDVLALLPGGSDPAAVVVTQRPNPQEEFLELAREFDGGWSDRTGADDLRDLLMGTREEKDAVVRRQAESFGRLVQSFEKDVVEPGLVVAEGGGYAVGVGGSVALIAATGPVGIGIGVLGLLYGLDHLGTMGLSPAGQRPRTVTAKIGTGLAGELLPGASEEELRYWGEFLDIITGLGLAAGELGVGFGQLGRAGGQAGSIAPGAGGLRTRNSIFQEPPRLTGVPEFDQLANGTPAFRRFAEKLKGAGYEVRPQSFKNSVDGTVAGFDGKVFTYDPEQFRVFNLLHENRHFGQLQRAERLGLGDLSGPHPMGRGRIIKLLETEAYQYELWLGRRFGFSDDYMRGTRQLLDEYQHGARSGLQYSEEFRRFADELLGYDLLPYIPKPKK